MTFKSMDKETSSPSEGSNVKSEFIKLWHSESQKKFDQPSKRTLLVSFVGTLKHLKKILYGKRSN